MAAGDEKLKEKENFRAKMGGALEQRLFYIPSFKIYGGVAGLYDYGPPGCAVKSNLQAFWRQHFVLNEQMLEVECPAVTPEVVLQASGHVDRFTDLMVNDVVTKDCFRADHLVEENLERMMADPMLTPERRRELEDMLARLEEFTPEEMGAAIDSLGLKAPETKNDLTAPYPFNLMFPTQIGPSGQQRGFMRPETAQGIFVNFRDLLYYNGGKLPFAAAQIGQSFRNEIAPRQALLRVREFTQAEIEHFVHPDHKEHPRFGEVKDVELSAVLARSAAGDGEAAVSDVGGRRRREGRHRQRDAGVLHRAHAHVSAQDRHRPHASAVPAAPAARDGALRGGLLGRRDREHVRVD